MTMAISRYDIDKDGNEVEADERMQRGGMRPNFTRRQVLGGLAASAATALLAASIVSDRNAIEQRIYGPERQDAKEWLTEKGPQMLPVVLKIDSRVATRETPDIYNSDHHGNGDDNRAGILTEEGKFLIVRNPIVSGDFYGFMDPTNPVVAEDFASITDKDERATYIADHTLWVASFAGDSENQLIHVYEDPRATAEQLSGQDKMHTTIGEDGQFYSALGGNAGLAQILGAQEADFALGMLRERIQ